MEKQSNPKDALGSKKVSLHLVPPNVLMEIALGMTEGACKYGSYNYRVLGVRASTYYSAAMRHMMAYWNGQDIDPDSGIHHLSKAMSCLTVMIDAMHQGMFNDDRPPKTKDQNWVSGLNEMTKEIIERYPEPKEPYTEL